jgi:putative endonuclease
LKNSHAPARQRLGRRSEQLALRLLTSQRYVIEETNVRFPVGEIDIVAREGKTLCFVEVRSTTSSQWGGPLASIGDRKRHRIIQAARWYLSRHRQLPPEIRFDVVAIDWRESANPTTELVRGAFG